MEKPLAFIKMPTTLLVVDDNQKFLTNFSAVMDDELKYKTFNSVDDVISFVKKMDERLAALVKEYFCISIEDVEMSKPAVNFDVNKLHTLIYDPKRFGFSSVMVTDYAMPGTNGLTLSEILKNSLIKKIMLTGEAGYEIGVGGFNLDIIDKFILKSEVDYLQRIKEAIHELESKFFQELSLPLVNAIIGKRENIFFDKKFQQFFYDFIKKNNIIEYYLLESSGSYLMLDADANIYWLIVKNDEDMQVIAELAEDDREVPISVIDDLKNKRKLAYFPSTKHQIVSAKFWPLIDAHLIEGEFANYYYGVVKGTDDYYRLNTKEIVPYNKVLLEPQE